MSIGVLSSQPTRRQYTAAVGQTDFDYAFPIFADADLVVDVDGTVKTLNVHYTVAGETDDLGGTVTFLTPMTGGEIVTLYSDIPIERISDFQPNGPFESVGFNDELDRIVRVQQQLNAMIKRALRFPMSGAASDTDTLFDPIDNWKGKFLYIDENGVPTPSSGSSGSITAVSGVSVAELTIYKRSASPPATPTGGSFNFSTRTLTVPAGWSDTVLDGNDPIYVSATAASITGPTGVDSSLTWSAPVRQTSDGQSVNIVFRRAPSQPATPSPSAGVPTDWYDTTDNVPAGSDPIWSSIGTRENAGQTWTWQSPTRIEADDNTLYYCKATNGTAIKNGLGTLTVEAHRLFAGTDTHLSSGTVQLYDGSTLITEANGYAVGSDGYTAVLDAGDISNSTVVILKDGAGGAVLDSITLVDIADGTSGAGAQAVYGYIEPSQNLAWVRGTDQSTWTPSNATNRFDCTFIQAAAEVARVAWLITRAADGTLTGASTTHSGGDLNSGRVTVTEFGEGTRSFTPKFTYSYLGDESTVSETCISSLSGSDGSQGDGGTFYYIKATNGTSIRNSTGTLTVEARKVVGNVDTLLSTGTIRLYVGSTLVTVANGYYAGSDGYTGVFDSGDITGDVVVLLKDGSGGTVYNSLTLTDITDSLTVSLSKEVFSIACDAGGTPKSGAFTNATGQVTVYSGTTDVTASCTFSSSASSVTGSINTATNTPVTGAKGSYRVTALSADEGYLDLTIAYAGISVTRRVTAQKVRAGAASASAEDTSFSDVTVTSYPASGQAGTLEIPVGPNGTIRVSANAIYYGLANSGTCTCTAKVQYREKGSSTWLDFASSETTGTVATWQAFDLAWDDGGLALTEKTMAGPSTLKVYEFQLVMKQSGNGTGLRFDPTPSFLTQWTSV